MTQFYHPPSVKFHTFLQSQKRLYNRKCLSVCLSNTETPKPLRIAPIDHQAFQPSCLLSIKPINHQAYWPLSPSTIKPINLWSSFATFKPFTTHLHQNVQHFYTNNPQNLFIYLYIDIYVSVKYAASKLIQYQLSYFHVGIVRYSHYLILNFVIYNSIYWWVAKCYETYKSR